MLKYLFLEKSKVYEVCFKNAVYVGLSINGMRCLKKIAVECKFKQLLCLLNFTLIVPLIPLIVPHPVFKAFNSFISNR